MRYLQIKVVHFSIRCQCPAGRSWREKQKFQEKKKQENYTFIDFFDSGNLEYKNEKRFSFNSKPSFRIVYRLASIWPYSNITVQGKVYVQ